MIQGGLPREHAGQMGAGHVKTVAGDVASQEDRIVKLESAVSRLFMCMGDLMEAITGLEYMVADESVAPIGAAMERIAKAMAWYEGRSYK